MCLLKFDLLSVPLYPQFLLASYPYLHSVCSGVCLIGILQMAEGTYAHVWNHDIF